MRDQDYAYDDPDLARGAANFKRMFGEIYGSELCSQLHEGPVGMNRFVMTQIGPMVWERDGLDMKTRMFVALAVLAALGREETRFFMRGALCNGATRAEIEEVLIVTGQEAGFPCAALAAKRLDEAEAQHNEMMERFAATQQAGGEG
ncbi:carboxymuconolactone decarboxylase family protein [Novosphingobium sp. BL-52-GroH]|uniref:carboxymuconolactone decarboxylase family protein n=1 Tax=Novosphingobium sp. BL-52-GroH TaxID=3349877 RepID=UPI00384F1CF5